MIYNLAFLRKVFLKEVYNVSATYQLGLPAFCFAIPDTLIPRFPRLMQQKLTKHDRHQKQQRVLRVVDGDCAALAY